MYYRKSIREVESGKYLIKEDGKQFILGDKEKRVIFFDEIDAENTLEKLNYETEYCFVLVDEPSVLQNIKIGDMIVCFDEYSHDYTEHILKITNIENDVEEGIILYGDDLTYPEEETDDYISRVTEQNFIRIVSKKFFYTFGTDKQFPFHRGYVEVHAENRTEADQKFRQHFSDYHPGILNCAWVYDEENFKRIMADLVFERGEEFLKIEKCHKVIE